MSPCILVITLLLTRTRPKLRSVCCSSSSMVLHLGHHVFLEICTRVEAGSFVSHFIDITEFESCLFLGMFGFSPHYSTFPPRMHSLHLFFIFYRPACSLLPPLTAVRPCRWQQAYSGNMGSEIVFFSITCTFPLHLTLWFYSFSRDRKNVNYYFNKSLS